MKISNACLNIIIEFEGNGLPGHPFEAYPDSGGVWTIGYGHTAKAGLPIPSAHMKITEQIARDILARDVSATETQVLNLCRHTPTQNQFDAMVSLCFNIGVGSFSQSHVLSYFNTDNLAEAAHSFALWNKGRVHGVLKVLAGLVKRRALEATLFLNDHVVTDPIPKPVPPVITPATSTLGRFTWWTDLKSYFHGH